MKILISNDTSQTLGTGLEKCNSRSLFYEKFVDPRAKKEERDALFTKLKGISPDNRKVYSWGFWLNNISENNPTIKVFYAKNRARLMVNMSGGVIENAGLCLDRFGMPYIPGSAVKGCARRMAIQELLETRESGKSAEELAQMLSNIAIVFGWGEEDWKSGKRKGLYISDFFYAIGEEKWDDVFALAGKILLNKTPKNEKDFGAFGGTISFLPAYPLDPENSGNIEIDVITCHHMDYYAGKRKVATDDEDPNPVKFPAIAAGNIFAFCLISLNHKPEYLDAASNWLQKGLKLFGIGAKTAAGYGWFEIEENRIIIEDLKNKIKQKCLEERKKIEDEIALSKMSPFDKLKMEYSKLSDEKFAEQAKKFKDMTDIERQAFLHILKTKEKRERVKTWIKKKPELIQPWIEFGKTQNPPITLP